MEVEVAEIDLGPSRNHLVQENRKLRCALRRLLDSFVMPESDKARRRREAEDLLDRG